MNKVLFVHTRFNWRKPLTYLSLINRTFQGFYYNHCAFLHNGVVTEWDVNFKETTYSEWLQKHKSSVIEEIEVPFEIADIEQRILQGKRVKGYDYFMWINYASICLFNKVAIRNDSCRLTCSEYVAFLLGFDLKNSKMPRELWKFLTIQNFKIN